MGIVGPMLRGDDVGREKVKYMVVTTVAIPRFQVEKELTDDWGLKLGQKNHSTREREPVPDPGVKGDEPASVYSSPTGPATALRIQSQSHPRAGATDVTAPRCPWGSLDSGPRHLEESAWYCGVIHLSRTMARIDLFFFLRRF